ncbi:PREDICTED: ras-related protein Rab-7a-like [Camelina sativa]|uniref:Ras-related protein Rab-7a-like n=1 Tax=Camelina sativa TaxID=90675 RepID=A0ABM0UPG8_CAMSA|nr:PREDICTED: ras-related protein Rab-7a-like [Camelina sativa]XP_010444145.1 PREDICTED: ras-related protein Rab-7a-like [Camelina sativa]XP_010444147.1 PREDICTED: ras-related protein Rab-7a-like [Camelina sativa]XP_010444148.1 PREDICTED: ras-related protein Rab-7a-like [Camelina sativa]XP_019088389.1 PREDICTED: ras-related protein Rab-7a-like [Camelina sativa]XP_019088390.1 PREDICTED: ras-related protein Rab-7a-like [Camelina sativa]
MSLQVFIVDDKWVAKTSLVTKFLHDNPGDANGRQNQEYEKQIWIDNRKWNLEIIVGNECWLCIPGYDHVACCVLVYDVYNRQSFENLTKHIEEFFVLANPKAYKFKFVVLGNKIDKIGER